MAFEISLRQPILSFPRVLRAHSDEPQQEYHWIKPAQENKQGNIDPGRQGENPQKNKDKKGHRPLSAITNDEVDEIARLYGPQLVRTPLDGWVARNNFCRVHLKRQIGRRPSVVFGRVKSCYPEDGHADNVQEFELYLPNKNAQPDVIQVQSNIINFNAPQPVETFCLRTRLLFSPEETAEFQKHDNLFLENGFAPDVKNEYMELLEMNDRNQQSHPWIYVVGSRWFGSLPESRYYEVKAAFKEMLGWGKLIINYHPDWLPKEIHPLNRVLGLKYRLSKHYLTEPESPNQTADITSILFDEIFNQGLIG